MFSYIYIIFLVCALSYSIYRDIVIYKKGNYKSYPFKEGKINRLFNGSIIMILLAGLFFIKSDEADILLIVLCFFAPIIALKTIIFNYLFYKKTKNKKIIFNTIMYVLMMIILFTAILK